MGAAAVCLSGSNNQQTETSLLWFSNKHTHTHTHTLSEVIILYTQECRNRCHSSARPFTQVSSVSSRSLYPPFTQHKLFTNNPLLASKWNIITPHTFLKREREREREREQPSIYIHQLTSATEHKREGRTLAHTTTRLTFI